MLAEPGRERGCFAAGVRELDADFLGLRVCEGDEGGEAVGTVEVGVAPDAGVFGGDAAGWEDRGGFDYGEAGAAGYDASDVGHCERMC